MPARQCLSRIRWICSIVLASFKLLRVGGRQRLAQHLERMRDARNLCRQRLKLNPGDQRQFFRGSKDAPGEQAMELRNAMTKRISLHEAPGRIYCKLNLALRQRERHVGRAGRATASAACGNHDVLLAF